VVVLDAVEAFGAGLPGLKLPTKGFRFGVLSEQKASHAGASEDFFALLLAQLLIDVVKYLVLGETPALSNSRLQLIEGYFGVSHVNE